MHLMTAVENTPVLVAGGGPAGLAAAAELACTGWAAWWSSPGRGLAPPAAAKTTSVRTMEHLRRWGVADALRAAAPLPVAWSQRVTFCESLSGRRITDFDGAFGLTTERDDRFAESGQQVPQPVVEEVLRAHVAGAAPASDLRLGHTVTGAAAGRDGVDVTVRDQPGAGYQIRARYVLGCDGAAGVVRDQIGARYAGHSDPRPTSTWCSARPRWTPTSARPCSTGWWARAAPGLIGRLDLAGTWWAILPGVEPEYGTAHAAELITGLVGAPVEHEVLASDPWTARMLIADPFADRRVFLVGESAHVNPPWGGHGFNTCVGDAVNIAWKIAAVEHGWAPPALLASYEPERRGVIEQTVASAAANMRAPGPRPAAATRRPSSGRSGPSSTAWAWCWATPTRVAGRPARSAARPRADVTRYTPDGRARRAAAAPLAAGRLVPVRPAGPGFTLVGPWPGRAGVADAGPAGRGATGSR